MEPRRLHKAKRIDNGEWVEGYYQLGAEMDNSHYIHEVTKHEKHGYYASEFHKIDPKTLCQCTGKMDVNKRFMYEHDEIIQEIPYGPNLHGIVGWCNIQECWRMEDNKGRRIELLYLGKFEVMGNIHD